VYGGQEDFQIGKKNNMVERRYKAAIERLLSPERVAMLEVEQLVDLGLEGIHIKSVLDAGMGNGIFTEHFAQKQISVSGVDPNPAC